MRTLPLFPVVAVCVVSSSLAGAQPGAPTLDIYHVDVEGGAATLIVTPARESLLVDAGWPGNEDRDARRITAAMKTAGITRIDHLIVTHYHVDHFGGVPALAGLVPVGRYYDHGPMAALEEDKAFAGRYAAYTAVARDRRTLAPGDVLTLGPGPDGRPVTLNVVAARGTVRAADAAARPNPACSALTHKDDDPSDNARSVAFRLTFGTFDFFDAGDLTWNVEAQLVCPSIRVAPVDLYQVTHHGLDSSNNPVLLRTLAPTVAVMNNGPRKGGSPAVVRSLRELPTLQALYQMHRNVTSGADDNTAPALVANPDETPDAGHMISVHVASTGAFEVVNHRTGERRAFTSTP